jgi:pullulanase/glycogen debranching enzyme
VSFFAPKASYASFRDHGAQVLEFKQMVLYLMFNAGAEPASFVLPELTPSHRWVLAIDTGQPVPDADAAERPSSAVKGAYGLGSRSSAVLVATPPVP